MATLNTHVHVTDEDGRAHVFGPADEVPEWAQALITNPKAWAEAPSANRSADPEPKPATKRAAPRRKAAADDAVHDG